MWGLRYWANRFWSKRYWSNGAVSAGGGSLIVDMISTPITPIIINPSHIIRADKTRTNTMIIKASTNIRTVKAKTSIRVRGS